MLESSIISVEEFFMDKSNQGWRPLSSHSLKQSPWYPIIDKRQYINDSVSATFYYCKLHPDIENINLESIEHHCKYRDPELHKSEILSETHKRLMK